MSYGKMNTTIDLIEVEKTKDSMGFVTVHDKIIATVRAYFEPRHGSERWANRALFSEATALFRLRVIPDITITTANVIVCESGRYEITSVDDIKHRGIYNEILAKRVIPSG